MTKVDEHGEFVRITDDGLFKLDGIIILRRVLRGGKLYLQFCDSDRMRSQLRKTRYVEIPIDVFVARLQGTDRADELVAHSPME